MRHDIIEYAEISPAIGRTVTVTVDRPLGSYHPEHKDMYYPINYGYVEGIMAPDGEEQDAYILGVDERGYCSGFKRFVKKSYNGVV